MEGYDSDDPFIFRLNDNGTGPSLLVKVCAERGWRIYQGGGYIGNDDKWNLWWRSGAFPAGCYKTLGDWQFMNHIPKGGSICRKDNLSRLLRCMRRIHGAIYDFSPPCYHLPLEYAKLVSECSRLRRDEGINGSSVVWIHKPVAQSQGRGIFLFRSICEMSCGTAAVVQRYIERPLLIAGYKFDLRLYVCVPGYRPLTAYMYAEGLARFGTDTYTLSDIHNPYRHLTNSSLNKSGPRYAECKDRIGSGCKWTLKQVRRALIGRWGAAEWLVWQRIRAIVTLTLLAQAAGTPPARNCFEFYGFDVLLDDSLKPWLIEVNLSPALGANCEADIIVKQPMLHELFDLLGLPMKHTGLALLQGPLSTPMMNNYSSEDENGLPRSAPASSSGSATSAGGASGATARRGRRRRRTAMPVHCVTLNPPVITDKYIEVTEKNKETFNGRYKTESVAENSDAQATSGTPAGSAESTQDETWRGGYATAASRRRMMNAATWGNGVRWNRAIGRVGHWVRIYPHTLPKDDEIPMEDARESVGQISRLVRAARETTREVTRDRDHQHGSRDAGAARDQFFEDQLRKKLDWQDFESIMMEETKKLVPFDSFSKVFKIMLWAGYYKLDNQAKTWKKTVYEIYRIFALIIVTIYNLQYAIYTLKASHNVEKLAECLMLEIPHTNLWVKVFTVFFQIKKIQKLNEVLKDGIFCTSTEGGQKILQKNFKETERLLRITVFGGVNVAATVWICSSIAKRINGEYEVIPMYIPYRTDTVFRFFLMTLNQIGPILWMGYGHIAMDVLFATYYAQAHTQLKIIQQELIDLLGDETHNDEDYLKLRFQYKDLSDESIKERFILVVKRYKKLIWYVKEVDSIFNVTLSFQFITSVAAVCFVIYGMTKINAASFQFLFFIMLFFVITTQVFLYCYFGNFVYHESLFLNDSLYESDWLSLSPSFRRMLLVAMVMWSKPLQPTVCGIVRLSLSTFVTIIRSSYTLYTVLITTNNDN